MATQRPQTPQLLYNSVPQPNDPSHLSRGYGGDTHLDVDANDFATTPANPPDSSPLSQSLQPQQHQRLGRFEEEFDARTRGSSILMDGDLPQRSASRASTLNQGAAPSRSGTLKKKSSVRRSGSLKRSGSRRSVHAGSIRGVSIEDEDRESSRHNSVFYTPVPTSGSPTEILANRFQAWRKLLKDLITYFREVSTSYEHRAKALLKVSNVINNTNAPSVFMTEGGLNDANRILRDFHKQSVVEANKARDIESEVINQLSGLRADLGQKIKEIKSLSGDFKNSVEKEKETTRKCVTALEEALSLVDADPSAVAGKGDPYVVRLGVDRQVERQIDEENYLHRAYLNLENSGRELESIVVGEIQKAYNALASILKRDADEIYSTIDKLRNGPIGMPRDLEWNQFVTKDPHFVNPNIPLRRLEEIEYPGKHHPATTEVRAGMLERKSKYLKSYTPGWYVLSPTHLHEFKSADRIYTQPPIMSLYLPDQKLGSHSQPGSSSHKFVLKGRQTGSMHRGHTWVFRAESYDTMLAWYDDVKNLTEKSGEERNAFVRRHTRSVSQGSARSVSSDGGLEEDEADEVPYSANHSINQAVRDEIPQRPSPGGRFPSDLQVNHSLIPPPSSGSSDVGNDLTTASSGLQGTYPYAALQSPYEPVQLPQHSEEPAAAQNVYAYDQNTHNPYQQPPIETHQSPYYPNPTQPAPQSIHTGASPQQSYDPSPPHQSYVPNPQDEPSYPPPNPTIQRHESNYGDWMAPAVGGVAAGALGAEAYRRRQLSQEQELRPEQYPLNESSQDVPNSDPTAILKYAPINVEPVSPVSTVPTSAANESFLDEAEAVPVAASPKPSNGGHIFPPIMRHNTDVSVSDLHIPGQYPKTPNA
ncbi:uncharacterized protein BDR25DRAFT_74476 [Lindgomyces ingoldianus]|uniref:Uncharacterized protein n=1 Tax=Lindgomyces ingoldianus TaxID=673940 RepID=A0ACB6QK94_9PLEO|nr:uncharacterized protein BDR25DRAFT_74476 [Lindgomyces ingoldianus]KAF2466737.1 hypothetical protein BDR25DRAFT_74476 [Lindgomyces ingoldianus]